MASLGPLSARLWYRVGEILVPLVVPNQLAAPQVTHADTHTVSPISFQKTMVLLVWWLLGARGLRLSNKILVALLFRRAI